LTNIVLSRKGKRQAFLHVFYRPFVPNACLPVATVYPQIQMFRAYGSQRIGGDYTNGWNKFHPYNTGRAYGS